MRGRRLVAAGGLVMLLPVVTGCDGPHSSSASAAQTLGARGSPTTTAVPQLTDADYRNMTAQESKRILRLAPLPPGARRIAGKPRGWPPGGSGYSPSDSAFTRVSWYSVPGSGHAVQRFLRSHAPAGMWSRGLGDVIVGDGPTAPIYRAFRTGGTGTYRAFRARQPAAYTKPVLIVDWYDLGPRTFLRFASAIAPRRARTPATYPSGSVTSVDVDRIKQHYAGETSQQVLSSVRLRSTTDAVRMREIVAALDRLHGSAINDSTYCGGPDFDPEYTGNRMTHRFVVHTTHGELSYEWPLTTTCPQLDVIRAGRPINVPLDPGNLNASVTKILAD
jgi:hypothetical protein